jgi:hypothetical protein
MSLPHKNKTLTTFLATLLGWFGTHRFYLYGKKSRAAWLYFSAVPLSIIAISIFPNESLFLTLSPIILSAFIATIESLVIGLTADHTWDAKINPLSSRQTESHWVLALILVSTLTIATFIFLAMLARLTDLFLTGGAFG